MYSVTQTSLHYAILYIKCTDSSATGRLASAAGSAMRIFTINSYDIRKSRTNSLRSILSASEHQKISGII